MDMRRSFAGGSLDASRATTRATSPTLEFVNMDAASSLSSTVGSSPPAMGTAAAP